ncbi:MAG TPA: DUF559 domain-containing protein [Ktedonobacterales bacterium]|nr:DUF559 domain-containing protein [Ktedonobacterales bacterium]
MVTTETRPKPTLVKRRRAKELRQQQTDEENTLWQRLRRNQLNDLHFRRQHPIGEFIVDCYCGEARLVVEVDGSVHQRHEQVVYDAEQGAILTGRGLLILRIANDEILHDIEHIWSNIAAECSRRIANLQLVGDAPHAPASPSRFTGRRMGG